MGNYTVPVHCQLPIPAKFLLPCTWIYVPSTVDSSGYWKNVTVIKIWTHETRRISSALCYRWVKDTEVAFLSNTQKLYVLAQTITLSHAAWLTLHTLFFFFLLPFKSTVKRYFTQVYKYYFININLKSVSLYLWVFTVYLVMLSVTHFMKCKVIVFSVKHRLGRNW